MEYPLERTAPQHARHLHVLARLGSVRGNAVASPLLILAVLVLAVSGAAHPVVPAVLALFVGAHAMLVTISLVQRRR